MATPDSPRFIDDPTEETLGTLEFQPGYTGETLVQEQPFRGRTVIWGSSPDFPLISVIFKSLGSIRKANLNELVLGPTGIKEQEIIDLLSEAGVVKADNDQPQKQRDRTDITPPHADKTNPRRKLEKSGQLPEPGVVLPPRPVPDPRNLEFQPQE